MVTAAALDLLLTSREAMEEITVVRIVIMATTTAMAKEETRQRQSVL
jgi:hypothetical protein